MSIVKLKDKKSGVTYVYESESYWDKEKKQPRNKRTLIGKLDEETGEIIPTRKKKSKSETEASIPSTTASGTELEELKKLISEKEAIISSLKAELEAMRKEKAAFVSQLEDFYKKWI